MNLTREEILKMDYYEVNKPVGVLVMGLPDMDFGQDTKCPYCQSDMRYCGSRSWCSECREWRTSPYKDYGDDIAAAWEVMEKIKDEVFGIYWKDRPNIDDWCIMLKARDSYSGAEIIYGETFPLAICRAALLAVMS